MIKALQTKGQFQSLAEPNLVAESGKEASFLAGGEFPVPIAQGSGANLAISVPYKEFGVRLNFTPVIHGDRVHLKVRPEVSTLDFANGVLLNGFRIPALSTRRTETEVDLVDGQTFAIAGLINNTMNSTLQKIPGIGDIPILGLLFKSKAANKDQTELVVMITPEILPRNSPGVTHHAAAARPSRSWRRCRAKKMVEPLPPAFTPRARSSYSNADRRTRDRRRRAVTAAPSPAVSASAPPSAAAAAAILTPAHPPVVVVGPNSGAPAAPRRRHPSADPGRAERARPVAEAGRGEQADERQGRGRSWTRPNRKKEKDGPGAVRPRPRTSRPSATPKPRRSPPNRPKRAGQRIEAEAAKAAAEQAKRQAEAEQNHQKALDEAAAKAKEAEARYQAELDRQSEVGEQPWHNWSASSSRKTTRSRSTSGACCVRVRFRSAWSTSAPRARRTAPDLVIVDIRGDASSSMSSIERLRAGARRAPGSSPSRWPPIPT